MEKEKISIKEAVQELQSFKEENKGKFGDYTVDIGKTPMDTAIIQFNSVIKSGDSYKGKKVIKNGKELGHVCDVCSQRLYCLIEDSWLAKHGKCFFDKELRKKVDERILKKYNLNYPKKEVLASLEGIGFNIIEENEEDRFAFLTKHGAMAYVF